MHRSNRLWISALVTLALGVSSSAQVTDLGPGCAPSSLPVPPPILSLVGTPSIGTTSTLVAMWLQAPGTGFLAISGSQPPVPIPFGEPGVPEALTCSLHLNPIGANLTPIMSYFGQAEVTISIPNSMALVGRTFVAQTWSQAYPAIQLDDPGRFHSRLSNGLSIQIQP